MPDSHAEPHPPFGTRQLALLGWALVVLRVAGIARWPLELNCDSAMYLEVGAMLADGAVPYVDVVELNPPLIWYLSAIPVLLSRLLGLHVIAVFQLGVVGLAAGSSAALWRLFALAGARGPMAGLRGPMAGVVALVPLASLFITEGSFGQREHLYGIVALPFLLLRASRWRDVRIPVPLAVAVGLAAGVGVLLKPPHFLPALAVAEAWWLSVAWRRGARPTPGAPAPEVWALAATAAAYAAHWALLPEASWQEFTQHTLPLVVSGYAAFHESLPYVSWMLLVSAADSAVFLAAALWYARELERSAVRDLLDAAGILGLCGAVVFVAQHKGWAYHAIPINVAGYVGLATIVGAWAERETGPVRFPRLRPRLARLPAWPMGAVSAAGAAAVGGALLLVDDRVEPGDLEGPAAVVAAVSEPGDPVMVLANRVDWVFPAVLQANRRIGSRYPWSYPIALLYHRAEPDPGTPHGYRVRAENMELERRFLADLARDLVHRRPVAVLVEGGETCWACPDGMNMVTYLEGTVFGRVLRERYARVPGLGGELIVYRLRSESDTKPQN